MFLVAIEFKTFQDTKSYFNVLFVISVKLREFCKDIGCVLVAPVTEEDAEILQKGPSDEYELVSTEGMIGAKTRAQNSRCYLGMIRKGK